MNKSIVVGMLFSIGVATTGGVVAYALSEQRPQFAEILAVQPIKEVVKTPRSVCKDVAVTYQHSMQDQHRIAEAAVKTEVGGFLDNQVGEGKGQRIVTVADMVQGGAGSKNQERPPRSDFSTVTEARCSTIIDTSEKVVAYDVKYLINGTVKQMRMNRDPGKQIPVMGDQLVLTGDSAAAQQ